jgi:cytochrome c oxidase cbb3-type subunit 2
LINPRLVVPESVMPGYPWLAQNDLNDTQIQNKMRTLKNVFGHPYEDKDIENAPEMLKGKKEIDAVIHYLQGMGCAPKSYTGTLPQGIRVCSM